MDAKRRIKEFILTELASDAGVEVEDFADDESLIDLGVLDSLGMLRLIAFLDEEMKTSIMAEEFNLDDFATLDMIGGLLAQHIDFDVMYKPSRQSFVEALMCHGRGHYFDGVIPQNNVREVIKRLKSGRIVWYAPDQDYGSKQSVFAPFFGIPAATITATSRLAAMTGARIVFMSHFRQTPDAYLLNLREPPQNLPTGDDSHDAEIMNRVIEEEVRKAPEEYWWVHRRFKSDPDGGRRDLYTQ